jgi:hypothetical protein
MLLPLQVEWSGLEMQGFAYSIRFRERGEFKKIIYNSETQRAKLNPTYWLFVLYKHT